MNALELEFILNRICHSLLVFFSFTLTFRSSGFSAFNLILLFLQITPIVHLLQEIYCGIFNKSYENPKQMNAFCHFLVQLPLSLTKIDVYSVWSITQYGHIQQISNWKPTNVCIYHWHNLLDTNESSLAFVLFYGKHTNQLRKIT